MKSDSGFLTEHELAARWGVSVATIRKWRLTGAGPRFRKFNRAVRYAMPDIVAHENAAVRTSTSDPGMAAQ